MKIRFVPELLTKVGTNNPIIKSGNKFTATVCHTCEHHIIFQKSYNDYRCEICIVTERGKE